MPVTLLKIRILSGLSVHSFEHHIDGQWALGGLFEMLELELYCAFTCKV